MNVKRTALAGLAALTIAACSGGSIAEPTPSPEPSEAPIAEPLPTPSSTPRPEPSPTPMPTPVPVPVPSPTDWDDLIAEIESWADAYPVVEAVYADDWLTVFVTDSTTEPGAILVACSVVQPILDENGIDKAFSVANPSGDILATSGDC